jgi:small-conductance mechanosensitive channel
VVHYGRLTINLTPDELAQVSATLLGVKAQLDRIEKGVQTVMATESQIASVLNQIDATTNGIAANLTTVASVTTTISTEVDALVTALDNAGVSQALLDQATALGTKAAAASDALNAQIPVLNAIAAKGVLAPPPPPPPPPPAV